MASTTSPNHRLPVLMRVAAGERLHKIFVIHAPAPDQSQASAKAFRVLTKEEANGTLELLGYEYAFDGQDEHQSHVLRAPSVPPDMLLPIIRRLVERTHTDIKQVEVIDLTPCRTRLDQADRLAQHELLEAFDFE